MNYRNHSSQNYENLVSTKKKNNIENNNLLLSEITQNYSEAIEEFHQRNFVRVIYKTLRDNGGVNLEDFHRAIHLCHDYILEVKFF